MNRRVRYFLGAAISIPLLPILAYQGKIVRESVPTLPEAANPEGFSGSNEGNEISIIFIGESTIAGVGVDRHENGFPGAMSDRLSELTKFNVKWKVYAKRGYTASKVKDKILCKIGETTADLIVIGLGGNDAFTLNRPWKWAVDINELIKNVRKKFPNTPIAFANMPPIKEFPAFTPLIKFTIGNLVEIHGEELQKVVVKHSDVYYNSKIIILDEWISKLGNKYTSDDFFSDGVHPSQLTYKEWGKNFAEFLVSENVLQN